MGDNGEKGASGKCFGRRESGRRARARVAGSRSETNLKDGLVGVALGDDSESLQDSRQDQHNDVGSRANEDEEALDDVSGIRGELARQDEPASDGATDRALLAVGPPRTQNFREISEIFHNARGVRFPRAIQNAQATARLQTASAQNRT